MFQFPGFAFITLCIQVINTWFSHLLATFVKLGSTSIVIRNCQVGCPIQKFMDQSLFSAPHDLSQSITSFIASYCQGIHQTPFSRLIWSRRRMAPKSSSSSTRPFLPLSGTTIKSILYPALSSWFKVEERVFYVLFRVEQHGLVYLTWNIACFSGSNPRPPKVRQPKHTTGFIRYGSNPLSVSHLSCSV